MAAAIFVDDVSFYLALWLFCALVYETALDIERMLEKKKTEQLDSPALNHELIKAKKKVKSRFVQARIIVSVLIILAHIPLALAFMKTGFERKTRKDLAASWLILTSVINIAATLLLVNTIVKLR